MLPKAEVMGLSEKRKQLVAFLVITWAISSIFYFLIIKSGRVGGGSGLYAMGLMWSPGAAALLTCRMFGLDVSTLGWSWGKTRYQVTSYLIPLAYASVTYTVIWILGFGGFDNKGFAERLTKVFGLGEMPGWAIIALYVALSGVVGVIRGCASALGEEIGWRGFLVPQLAGITSFTKTALISGAVWAVWHYPVLIFADYNAGTPIWYAVSCFTVLAILVSFAYAWMRLKSGSLWTAVLLHASHNLFVQGVFDPLTVDTGRTRFITGEFGIGLAIASIVVAGIFWRKRAELATVE